MTFISRPALIISIGLFILAAEKAMALQGLAAGNMKA